MAQLSECHKFRFELTSAASLQAVNALDGTLLDEYTLTKPSNWSANSTVQASYFKTFEGNFTETWAEEYGEHHNVKGFWYMHETFSAIVLIRKPLLAIPWHDTLWVHPLARHTLGSRLFLLRCQAIKAPQQQFAVQPCQMQMLVIYQNMSLDDAGGDVAGSDILNTAEDQIFADNSSILATLANMTALAVSCSCLPSMTCSCDTSPPSPNPCPSLEIYALGEVT